jgi:hypothetical protein
VCTWHTVGLMTRALEFPLTCRVCKFAPWVFRWTVSYPCTLWPCDRESRMQCCTVCIAAQCTGRALKGDPMDECTLCRLAAAHPSAPWPFAPKPLAHLPLCPSAPLPLCPSAPLAPPPLVGCHGSQKSGASHVSLATWRCTMGETGQCTALQQWPVTSGHHLALVHSLHCTALHCTALHCTALHCTALHCTVCRILTVTHCASYWVGH